jgi:hypothetical protein
MSTEDMLLAEYDRRLAALIQHSEVFTAAQSPCDIKAFPSKAPTPQVVYIHMADKSDFSNWLYLATCWKIWDLDVRGNHKAYDYPELMSSLLHSRVKPHLCDVLKRFDNSNHCDRIVLSVQSIPSVVEWHQGHRGWLAIVAHQVYSSMLFV